MDRERQKDLLTAYLDRELSPDERAAVERSLESSAEAQGRLHELELTSRFLRRLPAQRIEADFADRVLDRLRRESLLRAEPQMPKRSNRRMVWWASGPLAAAAMLVLAIWLNREPHLKQEDSSLSSTPPSGVQTTRDETLAQAPSEPLIGRDVLPGDYLAYGFIVVDVFGAVEEIKALAVRCDIFESEPNLSVEQSPNLEVASVVIDAEREQVLKLLGQMFAKAADSNSSHSSTLRRVTFDKEEILSATEADAQKNLEQSPGRVAGLLVRSGQSPPPESEGETKESADKKTVAAARKEPASRAAVADSVASRPRPEAKDAPADTIDQSRSSVVQVVPAGPTTPGSPQHSPPGQVKDRRDTLKVYYGQDSLPAVE
ncbi:MAG: zf-HC2 domain-containing protein, partial [Planctomycetes bacterium]|nr:zf-HC2 domain-containing protein [Planctomycetota bacterium]